MASRISVALLAGGKSSRFGGLDKQELPFRGGMLGRGAALQALGLGAPVLVVGSNPRPYAGLDLSLVGDRMPGFGPLSGLHAALLSAGTPWVYLMACDMPFAEPAWFDRLARLAESDAGAAASAIAASGPSGPEPFHALYHARLIPLLAELLGNPKLDPRRRSLNSILRRPDCLLLPEAEARRSVPDWGIFRGANDAAELEALAAADRD